MHPIEVVELGLQAPATLYRVFDGNIAKTMKVGGVQNRW